MGFCPILVGSTGISKQCPRHIPFETIVTVAVGNDSFDLSNWYQTSKNAPHFLGFLPCHFLLGKRCGAWFGANLHGSGDLAAREHVVQPLVHLGGLVLRHGVDARPVDIADEPDPVAPRAVLKGRGQRVRLTRNPPPHDQVLLEPQVGQFRVQLLRFDLAVALLPHDLRTAHRVVPKRHPMSSNATDLLGASTPNL